MCTNSQKYPNAPSAVDKKVENARADSPRLIGPAEEAGLWERLFSCILGSPFIGYVPGQGSAPPAWVT